MPSEVRDVAGFPEDFLWGMATSAYQIEGAVAEDGRGPSIWDIFVHIPGKIADGTVGDVACDHYHRWEEDVNLLAELGVRAYRFSVSWPRVLPEGKGAVNERGLDFYRRLVEALHARGIAPVVTLYHWDLPFALYEKGGWAERDTAKYFAEYAHLLFRRLEGVPYWITLNEPFVATVLGYVTGEHAPGEQDPHKALRVAHHFLLGHALAVQAFRDEHLPGSKIGITNLMTRVLPAGEDREVVEFAHAFERLHNGLFVDPLFTGHYPREALFAIARILWGEEGARDGDLEAYFYAQLDLPLEDLESFRQPVDFLGVNYYSPTRVAFNPESPFGGLEFLPPAGEPTAMGWEVYPEGLTEVLLDVHSRYPGVPILVTENGAAYEDALEVLPDGTKRVVDEARANYIRTHVEAVRRAIERGADVRGYFVWSLLDNFEWGHGLSKRFGLVYVDYATLERIPKASYFAYRKIVEKSGR